MDKERNKQVSASIPHINDLRCIIGRISSTNIEDSSVESLYHRRILKCRLLIYLLPDEIIASPIGRPDKGDMYILTKAEHLLTGKIQSKLNDINIQYYESAEEVTRQIYEACLYYTILFKIAPHWNKVDQYFVQGKYFLGSLAYPTNAIKIEINISGEETHFYVSPACVKVPALSLEYFSLSERIIQNFMADDNGFIVLSGYVLQSWVYVLPSLKRGKVVSISKKIPDTCPFQDYQQLKKHWKNMYGYRLPETDVELIYFQIYFPGLREGSYTYPNCCVKSANLNYLRLENSEDIVIQFLKDLSKTVPQICGASLILQELDPSKINNSREKEIQKENIPDMKSWVAQNAGRILNQKEISQNPQSRLNRNTISSGNYVYPLDTSRNKPGNFRSAFSTLFDNPGSLKPMHNIIKDKNLREALNMEPFLRIQSANRKVLTSSSNVFPSVIRNSQGSSILELASSSYKKEHRPQKLLLTERSPNVETMLASQNQSMKINPEESLAADQTSKDDELFYNSLLRRRSSFDLNDFDAALGEKSSVYQISNKNLVSNIKENNAGKDIEIKSHYFEDCENKAENNEKALESRTTSSSKPKQYRLSNREKSTSQRVSRLKSERKDRFAVNFRTKDISSYFREKKRVKVSDLPEIVRITSAPKLIQTQLNIKRSGKVELCLGNEKRRLADGGELKY